MLTEQFLGGLNDEGMTDEILREAATLENTEDAMSECVQIWAYRVQAERAQKAQNNIKQANEFNTIRHSIQQCDNKAPRMQKKWKVVSIVGQDLCQGSALHIKIVKSVEFRKANHFKAVCKTTHW